MQTKIRARWPDTISSRLRDQDWHGLSPSMATAPLRQAHTTAPLKNAASCSQNKATPEEMVACWWFTAFVFFLSPRRPAGSCCAGHDSAFRRPLMGTPPKQPGPAGKFASASTGQTVHSLFFSLRGNGRCRAEKCDVGVPPHLCMGQLTQVKGVGGVLPSSIFFYSSDAAAPLHRGLVG
jgi:hypothetical protein